MVSAEALKSLEVVHKEDKAKQQELVLIVKMKEAKSIMLNLDNDRSQVPKEI